MHCLLGSVSMDRLMPRIVRTAYHYKRPPRRRRT
jgi:hypothetical protein